MNQQKDAQTRLWIRNRDSLGNMVDHRLIEAAHWVWERARVVIIRYLIEDTEDPEILEAAVDSESRPMGNDQSIRFFEAYLLTSVARESVRRLRRNPAPPPVSCGASNGASWANSAPQSKTWQAASPWNGGHRSPRSGSGVDGSTRFPPSSNRSAPPIRNLSAAPTSSGCSASAASQRFGFRTASGPAASATRWCLAVRSSSITWGPPTRIPESPGHANAASVLSVRWPPTARFPKTRSSNPSDNWAANSRPTARSSRAPPKRAAPPGVQVEPSRFTIEFMGFQELLVKFGTMVSALRRVEA